MYPDRTHNYKWAQRVWLKTQLLAHSLPHSCHCLFSCNYDTDGSSEELASQFLAVLTPVTLPCTASPHPTHGHRSGPGQWQQPRYSWYLNPNLLPPRLTRSRVPTDIILQPQGNLRTPNSWPAIRSCLTSCPTSSSLISIIQPYHVQPPSIYNKNPPHDGLNSSSALHGLQGSWNFLDKNYTSEMTGFTLHSWSHTSHWHSLLTDKWLFLLKWFVSQFPIIS